ncbi:hypothetical protein [Acinetobacter stercoris]|uniref:Uncharacterized protein n=1 Tax=Acinetobacter stercoris TaxID=2126983 RepID=A0A2U3MVS9_9GAMM|nr:MULTISPECIES: hypothetical protein [Acinetobacter]SPL69537.1 hypothetical protein KPC_0715 [Acinetobacter stercoris]
MKKTLLISSSVLTAIVLGACSSTPTKTLAIQTANNQYQVTGMGKSQIIAKNNAIAAANSTCGKKAAPVLIDEKTEYHGSLKGVVDEKTGQMINAAAGVIGSMIGKNNTLEKDTDYQTTISFTCKTSS